MTVGDCGERLGRLMEWARLRGVKFSHIVLERGAHASQPMLTFPGKGDLTEQLVRAAAMQKELAAEGFEVTRVKVEAAPWNAEVPAEDSPRPADPRRYFEHHVKLLLPEGADLERVVSIAEAHAAHLSRNARRTREDGATERFVTQRCYDVGVGTAHRRLEELLAALRADGQDIVEVEEEYVVYDSNLALDAGWMVGT